MRTKIQRHQRDANAAADEQALALAALAELVAAPPAPVVIWSYEASLALGDAYVGTLLDALGLPAASRDGVLASFSSPAAAPFARAPV